MPTYIDKLLIDLGINSDFLRFGLYAILVLLLSYLVTILLLKTFRRFLNAKKRVILERLLSKEQYLVKFLPLVKRFFYVFAISLVLIQLLPENIWFFVQKIIFVYTGYLISMLITRITGVIKDRVKDMEYYKEKPIDTYFQVLLIVNWSIFGMVVLSNLFGIHYEVVLTTVGAASAIVILVFKDAILGLLASIQLSFNDIVRVGDWIEFPKHQANGKVIEISLMTIKVQNWNNSYAVIPTYSLISESFINWRGMSDMNGIQIKRSLLIRTDSVRFLTDDDLKKLERIELIKDYLNAIPKPLKSPEVVTDHSDGTSLTNLGLFRLYAERFLVSNQNVNNGLMLMCQQLQMTPQGIPIQIYGFIKHKQWKDYENDLASIMEHFMAFVGYFDLELSVFGLVTNETN